MRIRYKKWARTEAPVEETKAEETSTEETPKAE